MRGASEVLTALALAALTVLVVLAVLTALAALAALAAAIRDASSSQANDSLPSSAKEPKTRRDGVPNLNCGRDREHTFTLRGIFILRALKHVCKV